MTSWRSWTVLALMAFALGGCPKSDDANKAGPAGSVAAQGSAAKPSGDAAAAVSAGDSGTGTGTSAFNGSYSVAPRAMYIPESKDWNNVKQVKDDPTKLVGDGTMTLSIEGKKLSGSIETGPAGPAIIEGTAIDGELRASVRRKDPKDDGLTGTLVAKVSGDTATGTLSLSESNAAIVREGKFALKKK